MTLPELAEQLADALARQRLHVVFAESCTAGLVSASLAAVPGISQWLCGSAVTYQSATKTAWLDVPAELIEAETAVSAAVAEAMARGALEKTAHADRASSVTGHLGPGAPADFDGVIFIGHARRERTSIHTRSSRFQLSATSRQSRQQEAAALVLQQTLASLSGG